MHGHRQSGGASLSALITTLSALSAALGSWCPAASADDGRGGECQPHWAPTFGAAPGAACCHAAVRTLARALHGSKTTAMDRSPK